ncbi:hypothetical protein [Allorhodopirellula solitaria]|uniref:Uncharacterized protein n=1 Tax=Allorhodopirellula solitaria TaxID=2527987 RepID=A0A5C5XQV8_9BACT|nr:hypothetical protein [Allorhodopirellula solitaria]TWT65038.1 hypothetical protein CA85_33830 [Allorhodopirellula solitaria]
MDSRIRQFYTLAFVLVLTFLAASLWGVSITLAWVRDLPNRIVIDEDALSVAIGSIVTESYRAVFRDGDTATQAQVLTEQFLPMVTDDVAGRDWVRDEYRDDLLRLSDSSDAAVASAASAVLAVLERGSDLAAPIPVK